MYSETEENSKIFFLNDTGYWCHPRILQALWEKNLENQDWYLNDKYSKKAVKLIKKEIWDSSAEVYFVSSWTQANMIILAHITRRFEAIITVDNSHINNYEAWAIEANWNKIYSVKTDENCKIKTQDIQKILDSIDTHKPVPKAISISNLTEFWTTYSKQELESLYTFCKKNDLFLFIDWARLWVALECENMIDMQDIAKNCDAFTIWWTKNWLLLWEAIVLTNNSIKSPYFRNFLKQKWALLSKSRVLWIQFSELFEDKLFYKIASDSIKKARKIKEKLTENWVEFLNNASWNQIFPILEIKQIEKLEEKYLFHRWKKVSESKIAIRITTSWWTKEEDIENLIKDIQNIMS